MLQVDHVYRQRLRTLQTVDDLVEWLGRGEGLLEHGNGFLDDDVHLVGSFMIDGGFAWIHHECKW